MRKVDLIVIALSKPIMIGVYEDEMLIDSIESDEHASDFLPKVFESLLQEYVLNSITYANGPGSFMAIKMSYLFIKSLEILKGIEFRSALAFEFNEHSPIKALGKLYFHYENGNIVTKVLDSEQVLPMKLPSKYKKNNYSLDTQPNFVLPAVN